MSQTDAAEPGRGYTRKALLELREKLIDIGKRNPLIAFKHAERGASYLRIIDETLDGLYAGLSGVGQMSFQPLPDPEIEPADQKTPDFKLALETDRLTDETYRTALDRAGEDAAAAEAAQRALTARVRERLGLPRLAQGRTPDLEGLARAHGIDPSLELPAAAQGAHHTDRKIRVLLLPDRLEGRLRTLYDRYRGHAAETGIHTLQLVLGFLQWREADASAAVHQAPLLTLAVDLTRSAKGYVAVGRDEGLVVNMALQEMLRRNHNLRLPELEEADAPETWLARARVAVAAAPGLSVLRWATLAVLPFPNMAVWRDLDPDAWPELVEHQEVATLLGGREADRGKMAGSVQFPADYAIDDWNARALPTLVMDADVSQHSALADVASKSSLALEGPPGTGKSQTIANMIAGALSGGRKVLFVAEKRAALEVVAERLRAVGLGDLLLELHSDKAVKAGVVADIKRALDRRGAPGKAGEDCAIVRDELLRQRDVLKRFYALLRQPIGALERPAGELVWREMRLRARAALPRAIWSRTLPDAAAQTPFMLKRARDGLDGIERTSEAIEAAGRAHSPWRACGRLPADPIGHQRTLDTVADLARRAEALVDWRRRLATELAATSRRLDALAATTRPFAAAEPPLAAPPAVLRAALSDPSSMQDAADRLQARAEGLTALSRAHPDPLTAHVETVASALRAVEAAMPGASTPSAVAAEAVRIEAALLALAGARQTAAPVLAALTLDPDRLTGIQARALTSALAELAALPPAEADLCGSQWLGEAARRTLNDQAQAAEALRSRRDALRDVRWAEITAEKAPGLEAHAAALASTPALLRLMSGRFKSARTAATHILGGGAETPAELSRRLVSVVSWRREADAFAGSSPARTLFGGAWRGCDTPFEAAASLRERLERMELALRRADLDVAATLAAARPMDRQLWGDWLAPLAAASAPADAPLAASEAELRAKSQALQAALQGIAAAGLLPEAPLRPRLSSELGALQEADRALTDDAAGRWSGWLTSAADPPAPLREALAWTGALRNSGASQAVLNELADKPDPATSARKLAGLDREGERLVGALRSAWDAFAAAHAADARGFLDAASLSSVEVEPLADRLAGCAQDSEALRLFAELGRLLAEAEAAGAAWVYRDAVAAGTPPSGLADGYELALVRTVLEQFLKADGAEVLRLGGAQLTWQGERFRQLDRQLAALEARRILLERLGDDVPRGAGVGSVKSYTELELIKNEVNKKRAIVPLRELVRRAGRALQAIKPVWMMSPTTVAQFAPPKTVAFDLIVIDEASQMTPEMAVGALARGAQIVVVGDPKQLPPSNHFQVSAAESEEEDGAETAEGGPGAATTAESILDLAYQKLGRRRRLKWHYRSRHESLIQFSNRQFYDRDLVVFPSATAPGDELGVRTIWAGGVYKGRVNEAEARAVIDAAVGLMMARPERSLGVVTMNADQRELLFQMFEDLKASQPAVRDYVARWEGGTESFFVKNLENVQGDERDVMIISTVYGPAEPDGKVFQRFGLLNRHDEGHRRLNVLVTRAKRANWVVTSLRPGDVVAGPATSRGVQAFQRYLAYAAGGAETDAVQPDGTPDSDFEVFVTERLREHGFEVVHQVGVEGFRIDLGVRHPAYPIGFLAGIECDGAAFHSHYTVRDRDRIRQSVLEGLGWRIWRVWSTDWFNNPDRETGRLLAWLEGLKAEAQARFGAEQTAAAADAEPQPTEASPVAPDPSPPPATADVSPAPPTQPASELAPRPSPAGRKREVDGIAYYEDPALPGLFSVWLDDVQIGTMERVGGAVGPAQLFGGAVRTSLPEYRVTREWDETGFPCTDIYEGLRRLGREARAREPINA